MCLQAIHLVMFIHLMLMFILGYERHVRLVLDVIVPLVRLNTYFFIKKMLLWNFFHFLGVSER